MTDEEVYKKYEDMLKYFNGQLPNPEHYPKCFAYHVMLYKYMKDKE